MWGMTWLDLLLIISLIGFLTSGLRKGFFVTLGAIVGFLAGGIAAFFGILTRRLGNDGYTFAKT